MSFTNEKFIPSATYTIVNVKHNRFVACNDGCLTSSSAHDFKWTITQLANKKWLIQDQPNGLSANMNPDPEEEDEIIVQRNQGHPHQWVIKRCTEATESYIIYSPVHTGLFWNLRNADEGTDPRLSSDNKDNSSWWKFSKADDAGNAIGAETCPTPLTVARPTLHLPIVKNRVSITIPPDWVTTISATSVGQCINLVHVYRTVQGVLESQSFVSGWDSIDQAMVLDGSGANSYAIPALDEPVVITLEFFHSRDTHRRDPLGMPGKGDLSTNFRTTQLSKPSDMRRFPDYQTFWVFDEQPETGQPNSGPSHNAIIIVQSTAKVTVDLDDPGKPVPGTVNEGYNENLDRPRPGYLDQYLQNYDIVFIIDDSGSMSGGRWKQVRAALAQIGNEAMQYDADGIDMCFLNSPVHKESITTQEDIFQIFEQVEPGGFTPTGAKLEAVLGNIIAKLDNAMDTPAYGRIKPVDIVVITDGVPTDDPAAVIQAAARQLDEGLHHPNAVGIQFVQIGNDEGADVALKQLCEGPVRSMVDTVPCVTTFTPDRLKRVLLGGLHPSIRAKL